MTIYLAEDLTAGEATPMDDEHIEAQWFKRKPRADDRRRRDRRRQNDYRILPLAGPKVDTESIPVELDYRGARSAFAGCISRCHFPQICH